MEIPIRDNSPDNIGNTVDLFLDLGKKSHSCRQRHRAGVPVEIRPKSSLDWDVTVRDDHAT